MIVDMVKVRLLGPAERLSAVLDALQDLEALHLSEPADLPGLGPSNDRAELEREETRLLKALEDAERALRLLGLPAGTPPAPTSGSRPPEPGAEQRREPGLGAARDRGASEAEADGPRRAARAERIRLARRARRELESLEAERDRLTEERASLLRYRGFHRAFRDLFDRDRGASTTEAYHLVLEPGEADALERLRAELEGIVGGGFELLTRTLESGEIAVVLLVPASSAQRVEVLMREAGIQELSIPAEFGETTLAEAVPAIEARLRAIERRLEAIAERKARMVRETGPALRRARAGIGDRLAELEAMELAARTDGAFVLEGWLPAADEEELRTSLADRFGDTVVVTRLATAPWETEEAPVVLSNPRLFRPFEAITRLLPLPTYGSIDPTPFVAVFFPMFFGLILGDVGYGAVLAALGLLLHRRSRAGTRLRSVAEIAGACAVFSIIFGFLYGELFGDLGRRWLGLEPLAFDREEALLPFLGLAVAIGLVHVVLGLVLGAWAAVRGGGKRSLGKGVAAGMVLLTLLALLAAVGVLPGGFFTPAIVALLIAFPILVALEGLLAPLELLSTLGNVLSYARIMALGTASVMMAVVANRMVGAVGSVLVGALFGLLFHVVNFALGVFGPTIHGLRLHYVEFFGKFYSPGGADYRPLGHWRHGGGEPPA